MPIDGRLTLTYSQFNFITSNDLHGQVAHDLLLLYFQQEIVKNFNQMLSSFNGMTIEELDFKGLTQGRVKLLFNILSKNDQAANALHQVNQRLSSAQISVRVSPDHLWLSTTQKSSSPLKIED
jgi:hypothetical protein